MKRLIGTILLLVGLTVMIAGVSFAFEGYFRIIQQVVENPLAEGSTETEPEKAQAQDMLKWAIVGACGAPVALAGAIMVFSAKRKKRLAKNLIR